MLAGVTIVDPASTWIDADVEIEPTPSIEPGTTLRGAHPRRRAARIIGPHTTLIDSTRRRRRSRVLHSYLVECEVGDGCQVGPVRLPAPGRRRSRGREGRHLRRDQELEDRRGGEGAAPVLRRRRRRRRRRRTSAPARSPPTTTASRKHRTKIGQGARIAVNTIAGRAGDRRRRRLHWRRRGDPRGRPGRGARGSTGPSSETSRATRSKKAREEADEEHGGLDEHARGAPARRSARSRRTTRSA